MLYSLIGILDESNAYRFVASNGEEWSLVYLVSEYGEKKLKWTDLKIGDVIKKKYENGYRIAMVIGIDTNDDMHISIDDDWLDDYDLEDWEKVV